MRIISQLARNTKGQDTFGQKDEDWDVYKQISREAGDSDSEEEGLRAAEYEAVLKEHEPQEEEVARDSPEWHQVRLAIERILLCSSLLGLIGAWLAVGRHLRNSPVKI